MQFDLENAFRIFRKHGFAGTIKKCLLYLRFPFYLWRKRKIKQEHGLNALVEFSFTVCNGLIKPLQVKNEILELLSVMDKEKPKIILEIGTNIGGNLFLFSQIAASNAVIISVDLPGGRFGGGYPRWRIPIFKMFLKKKQKLFLIRSDSHDPKTKRRVNSILRGRKIDFLFIDGDHTYEGVKQDFEVFSPMVKENGLIAFHDILPLQGQPGCGVDRLWAEISSDNGSSEIINNIDQGWAGIGLIRKS